MACAIVPHCALKSTLKSAKSRYRPKLARRSTPERYAFTGKTGELRFDKLNSDTYIYGDINGDGKADFAIHLDDAVALQKGYFVL
jgi:hypothetical protein